MLINLELRAVKGVTPVNWEKWGNTCEQCDGKVDSKNWWKVEIESPLDNMFDNYCEPFCSKKCALAYIKERETK